MPYTITPDMLSATTDLEIAFGTTRLLPKIEDIPDEFKASNTYTKLVESLFFTGKPTDGNVAFIPPFDDASAIHLARTVNAHLRSFEPKHEHKIAGVAYMISKVTQLS